MQKILVPINFNNDIEQVIQKSMQMAKAFSGAIYLVHVEQPIKDSSSRDNGDPVEEMTNDYADETEKLHALAQRIRDDGIETHAIFIEGVPSLSILEAAQKFNVELIVMGTHGHGVATSLLLGGVSQAIIKKSEYPVLLVPI